MASGNLFRHLWSIECPVEGPAWPSPYRCFLVDGWVPRKCILCPYLFEGQCAWETRDGPRRPFTLRVVPVPVDRCRCPGACLEPLVPGLLDLPDVTRLLVVVEGDIRLCSLQQGLGAFAERLRSAGAPAELLVSAYPGRPGEEGVRMFVVAEQAR